jgi:hypothetical protein
LNVRAGSLVAAFVSSFRSHEHYGLAVPRRRRAKLGRVNEPPLEVDASELDADDLEDDYPQRIRFHRGAPFTGVLRERDARGETRVEYLEGRRHGTYRALAPNGNLLGEGRYAEGYPVGESRGWAADGTLRSLHRYGPRGVVEVTQYFSEAGELRYERTPESERSWYLGGGLRSARRDEVRWAYARDGRCAYGEGVQQGDQARVYDHFVFYEQVLVQVCLELLHDYDFERGVWMWTQRRIDERDPGVLDDLRKFLAHPNLGARATALRIVGNRGLRELRPELCAMAGDERVPPMQYGEYPGQGGRGHTFSLGETARLMLAQLG